MATVRYEPIDKEVVFRFKDGRKGKGIIWKVDVSITRLDRTYEYYVSHNMFGNEATIVVDDQFNEIE